MNLLSCLTSLGFFIVFESTGPVGSSCSGLNSTSSIYCSKKDVKKQNNLRVCVGNGKERKMAIEGVKRTLKIVEENVEYYKSVQKPPEENAAIKEKDENATIKEKDENAAIKEKDENAAIKEKDENAAIKKQDGNAAIKKQDENAAIKKKYRNAATKYAGSGKLRPGGEKNALEKVDGANDITASDGGERKPQYHKKPEERGKTEEPAEEGVPYNNDTEDMSEKARTEETVELNAEEPANDTEERTEEDTKNKVNENGDTVGEKKTEGNAYEAEKGTERAKQTLEAVGDYKPEDAFGLKYLNDSNDSNGWKFVDENDDCNCHNRQVSKESEQKVTEEGNLGV